MPILSTGNVFADGDQVTAAKLNAAVNSASFVSGASGSTDNASLTVSGGKLAVASGGITSSKIASGVTINFNDGSQSAPSITNNGDSDTGLYFPSENAVSITTGGVATASFLQSAGYGSIEVAGPNGAYIDLTGGTINSPDYSTRLVVTPFSSSIRNSSTIPFLIYTDDTERFRVTENGDVGIGTSSPSKKLDVSGDVKVTGTISVSDGSAAAPSITNTGDSDTGIYFGDLNTISFSIGGTEKLKINSGGALTAYGDSSGYYFFMPAPSTLPFTNASRLEVRCVTAESAFKIETYNDGTGAEQNLKVGASANDSYAYFNINGNVGIGLTSPSTKLHVAGGLTVSDGVRGALKYETEQNATSTNVDFNSIPSWAKRITVIFAGVSISGANEVEVVLGTGTSGSPVYVTSGYSGGGNRLTSSGTGGIAWTTGFMVRTNAGATAMSGHMVITKLTGNTWVASSVLGGTSGDFSFISGGNIALGDALTQVRIKTTSTDTFDAGQINIMYEG